MFIIIYFVIIGLVIEISVVLMRLSGLDHKISRFQVISMLTGTGFTTIESELILRHPIRRKLSMFLILFGAFSLAVIISSISSILAESFRIDKLMMVTGTLLVLFLLLKTKKIQLSLEKKFHRGMQQTLKIHQLPIEEVLLSTEDDAFIDINISIKSSFIDRSFDDMVSDEHDLMLLFIKRGEEMIRRKRNVTPLQEGDKLIVYGNKQQILELFGVDLDAMNEHQQDEKAASSII